MRATGPTTGPTYSFFKFRAYPFDVLFSRFRFFDGDRPAYPFIASERRDVFPCRSRSRVRNESFSQVRWQCVNHAGRDPFFGHAFYFISTMGTNTFAGRRSASASLWYNEVMNKTLWAVVIAVVLVSGGILLYHAGKNTQQAPALQAANNNGASVPAAATSTGATTSPTVMYGGYFSERSSSVLGTYLADENGLTLYVYSKDAAKVSNCSAACLMTWVPYGPGVSAAGTFSMPMMPVNVGVAKGNNGMLQFTWKEMPVYRFVSDKKPGDAMGQGQGGVWSVIKI